jgi:hypothetical protein
MGFYRGPNIVTDGLVYALDAANSRSYSGSGTSATDLTGDSTSTTLVNGVGYSSNDLGYFDFDGIDDKISVQYAAQPATSGITVIAWIYPDEDATTGGRTRGSAWGGPGAMYLGLWPNSSAGSSAIHAAVQTASGRPSIYTGTIYTNQWSMLAMCYDGSNTKTYLNGELIGTVSQTGNITSGTIYYVGTYDNRGDSNHNWPGRISYATMYNRGLNATEIKQNYNAIKSRYGL